MKFTPEAALELFLTALGYALTVLLAGAVLRLLFLMIMGY